jgi:hypothetical protein
MLQEVAVFEKTAEAFQQCNPSVKIIDDYVESLDHIAKTITLHTSQTQLRYQKLCIATGVRPRLIADHPRIIGIRDVDSVNQLVHQLKSARKVAIIGNGGIALELIHELKLMEVDWILRDDYVGSAFFDATASDFILSILLNPLTQSSTNSNNISRPPADKSRNKGQVPSSSGNHSGNVVQGYGLGPEWMKKTHFREALSSITPLSSSNSNNLKVTTFFLPCIRKYKNSKQDEYKKYHSTFLLVYRYVLNK